MSTIVRLPDSRAPRYGGRRAVGAWDPPSPLYRPLKLGGEWREQRG
jgi:hypothetical protein